jgi:cytochrome c-type biogenesis protein CcmH/NrfG
VQRILVGSGTVLLGLFLLSLAVPRLIAQATLLPGNVAIGRALNGQMLSSQGYQRAFEAANAALGWVEVPEVHKGLGGTLYFMAQNADALHVNAATTLEEARGQLELGLAEEPADAPPWLWLADIRRFQGDPDAAARALRLSMLSAPHEVNLAPARAGMALALWPRLDPGTRALAEGDMRRALASKGASSFVRRMREAKLLPPLRRSLADDPVASATLWLLLRRDESAG